MFLQTTLKEILPNRLLCIHGVLQIIWRTNTSGITSESEVDGIICRNWKGSVQGLRRAALFLAVTIDNILLLAMCTHCKPPDIDASHMHVHIILFSLITLWLVDNCIVWWTYFYCVGECTNSFSWTEWGSSRCCSTTFTMFCSLV